LECKQTLADPDIGPDVRTGISTETEVIRFTFSDGNATPEKKRYSTVRSSVRIIMCLACT
jgi:hypothetical protein